MWKRAKYKVENNWENTNHSQLVTYIIAPPEYIHKYKLYNTGYGAYNAPIITLDKSK
jgi:hypothetical protein